MGDSEANLLFALPMAVVGVLLVGLGRREASRHLRTATGSWRTRLRSPALLLPGLGGLMLTIAALVALGLFAAGIGLLYAAGVAGVVALVVSTVRSYRAGRRRHALATAGFSALCLLEITALAFDWHVVFEAVFGLLAASLLVVSVGALARRWRSTTAAQRRDLLQSVALGLALVGQGVSMVLPSTQRTTGVIVDVLTGVFLLVSLGLLLDARRRRPRTGVAGPSTGDSGPGTS